MLQKVRHARGVFLSVGAGSVHGTEIRGKQGVGSGHLFGKHVNFHPGWVAVKMIGLVQQIAVKHGKFAHSSSSPPGLVPSTKLTAPRVKHCAAATTSALVTAARRRRHSVGVQNVPESVRLT